MRRTNKLVDARRIGGRELQYLDSPGMDTMLTSTLSLRRNASISRNAAASQPITS